MNNDLSLEIFDFLEEVDDMADDLIDRVEAEPIKLDANRYVTGFKRSDFSYTDIEFHIKEIRTIKLKTLDKSITDDDGVYMMEPDGEMWMSAYLLHEKVTRKLLETFKENFSKMQSFHLMELNYREKGTGKIHGETILYKNKRVAYKEAFKLKKQFDEVRVKFKEYNNVNGAFKQTHEPTDFEIAVAAAE